MEQSYSNEELITKIKNGDLSILDWLYLKYKQPVIQSFKSTKKIASADVEDLFHETIIEFNRSVLRNNFKKEYDLKGYLIGIMKNQYNNNARRKKRGGEIEEEFTRILRLTNILTTDKEEQLNKLRHHISHLSKRCKEVLELFYFRQLSYEEIAQELEIDANYAKVKKFDCQKNLKNSIKR